jgi:hypothetical protein
MARFSPAETRTCTPSMGIRSPPHGGTGPTGKKALKTPRCEPARHRGGGPRECTCRCPRRLAPNAPAGSKPKDLASPRASCFQPRAVAAALWDIPASRLLYQPGAVLAGTSFLLATYSASVTEHIPCRRAALGSRPALPSQAASRQRETFQRGAIPRIQPAAGECRQRVGALGEDRRTRQLSIAFGLGCCQHQRAVGLENQKFVTD